MTINVGSSFRLIVLSVILECTAYAFSVKSVDTANNGAETHKERPLLHNFGRQLRKRIVNSKSGAHRFGMEGAYTSSETFPCLDMQCGGGVINGSFSSRREIREAFNESSGTNNSNSINKIDRLHGKSSGSGCSIIRLQGKDAASIRGLVNYANEFFECVDYDETSEGSVTDVGVFKIDQFVYAGFDDNVNNQEQMQFLDTRILPRSNSGSCNDETEDILIPMEVGELVGKDSLDSAHKGISTLMDLGYQITSAVLEMNSDSADKLVDDGTRLEGERQSTMMGEDVSNSYHRLIRYINSGPSTDEDTAAFQSHIDSSFLTLIPMPELPGLEIWSPCLKNGQEGDGEWVRPIKPDSVYNDDDESAYVIAMAGEFLQLTSNGKAPACIHRVLPAMPGRISAPLFLRPRRDDDALLDVNEDLDMRQSNEDGLYFQPGLLDECDSMHLWSAHGILNPA